MNPGNSQSIFEAIARTVTRMRFMAAVRFERLNKETRKPGNWVPFQFLASWFPYKNRRQPALCVATLALALFTTGASSSDDSPPKKPGVLPGIQGDSPIDVSSWRFRKPVKVSQTGVQELELDVDVLAHAQSNFADLRLVRKGNQVPYIFEQTSISRTLELVPQRLDLKDTHWLLPLPHVGTLFTRLTCTSPAPFFDREVFLYDGRHRDSVLVKGRWVQSPARPKREFAFDGDFRSTTEWLDLTVINGDNPPIILDNFRISYPASRLVFTADAADTLFLYYGNSKAVAPLYDLRLVDRQLLFAEKSRAVPGKEERQGSNYFPFNTPDTLRAHEGVIFWTVLIAVTLILLLIISRLIPKPPPTEPRP